MLLRQPAVRCKWALTLRQEELEPFQAWYLVGKMKLVGEPWGKGKTKQNRGSPGNRYAWQHPGDAGTPQGLGPIAQTPEAEEELGSQSESSLTAGLGESKDTKEAWEASSQPLSRGCELPTYALLNPMRERNLSISYLLDCPVETTPVIECKLW